MAFASVRFSCSGLVAYSLGEEPSVFLRVTEKSKFFGKEFKSSVSRLGEDEKGDGEESFLYSSFVVSSLMVRRSEP